MRRAAVLLAALVALLPASASAGEYPTGVQATYFVCTLTTAAATPCLVPANGGPTSVLAGVANNSLTAQTATVTCYDNPTAANGPVAASIAALGATQIISWPLPGRPLVNGLTCQASGVPSGAGIEIYFR